MSLSAGIFTITNLSSSTHASLPTDDDRAGIICKISTTVTEAEQWELIPSEPRGRYKMKNVHHKYYAACNVNCSPAAPVFGAMSEGWWLITQMDPVVYGEDSYCIHRSDYPNFGWTLPGDFDGTPIELHPFAKDRHSIWKITPYPPLPMHNTKLPFEDHSIISVASVERTSDAQVLAIQLKWMPLPPGVLQFPEPILVVSHSEVVAEVIVEGDFRTKSRFLHGMLRVKDTSAFSTFAATVLRDDDVQVSLEAFRFRFYPEELFEKCANQQYEYRCRWKKSLTFDGLRSYRDGVNLRNMRIIGSADDFRGRHMRATVTAEIMNSSRFNCMASVAIGVFIGNSKIGTAQLKELQLRPGLNEIKDVEWEFCPVNPANHEIQEFLDKYIMTNVELPVTLKVESINATICGHLINLPRFDINTRIKGIGSRFIEHVTVHASAITSLLQRKVSFSFTIENPLDAMLEICAIALDVHIKGAHIATVKHSFEGSKTHFIIPPRDSVKSPKVSQAWLVAGFVKTLQLAMDTKACLDVRVKSVDLRIDQFHLQGLTFTLPDINFTINWFT